MNTQTTQHQITFKGQVITIKGKHEYKYLQNSKMSFEFSIKGVKSTHIRTIGTKSKTTFKQILDMLIDDVTKGNKYAEESDKFRDSYKNLSPAEKIAHPNFKYSRFQNSGLGNYYNIYWKNNQSPTGVELVGGCDEKEWETISKETGNQNNYLSPTENKMTAH